MPFKSEAQRRYLYANEPEVAKEFESKTPKGKKLPEKVKDKKKEKKMKKKSQALHNSLKLRKPAAHPALIGAGMGAGAGAVLGGAGGLLSYLLKKARGRRANLMDEVATPALHMGIGGGAIGGGLGYASTLGANKTKETEQI